MVPAEKLVRVPDGTVEEPEGVMMFNVQVAVEDFKFLADIVVMDMPECPLTFDGPFLVTSWTVNISLRAHMPSIRAQGTSRMAPEALDASPYGCRLDKLLETSRIL